jgi:DNA helicase HerA-like ATPase
VSSDTIKAAIFLLIVLLGISLFFNFQYAQEKEVQERQYKTYLNHYYGVVNDSLQILNRLLDESQDEEQINKELIVLSEHLNRLAYMSSKVPYYISDIEQSGMNLFEFAANVIIYGGFSEYDKIPPFIEDNKLTRNEKAYLEGIKDHIEYIHDALYSEETGQENRDLSKVEFNHITRYITGIIGEHDILLKKYLEQ